MPRRTGPPFGSPTSVATPTCGSIAASVSNMMRVSIPPSVRIEAPSRTAASNSTMRLPIRLRGDHERSFRHGFRRRRRLYGRRGCIIRGVVASGKGDRVGLFDEMVVLVAGVTGGYQRRHSGGPRE